MKWLKDTQKDYRDTGYYTELKDGVLTVFALQPKKPKKKDKDEPRRNRNAT